MESAAFVRPEKKVKSPADIKVWEKSEAYAEYLGFVQAIGSAISGRKIRDAGEPSSAVAGLLSVLATLNDWIEQCPPEEQQQRFGNKAYRTWHKKLEEEADGLIKGVLPESLAAASVEVSAYLEDSFGNATRIDYGTGHEMAFVTFLSSLFKIGALQDGDRVTVGLTVFDKYLQLCRKLQRIYNMEPAGSQGVWNLDDFQFVPFIWGAAQLVKNARVKPKSIDDYDIAQMLAQDYHFFACIKFISEVKTGPFAEHSNQLWNISGVPTWEKVQEGLIKMYRAEVLCKFPVIQHVFFGSVFTLAAAENPVPELALGSVPKPRGFDPVAGFPGGPGAVGGVGGDTFPRPPSTSTSMGPVATSFPKPAVPQSQK